MVVLFLIIKKKKKPNKSVNLQYFFMRSDRFLEVTPVSILKLKSEYVFIGVSLFWTVRKLRRPNAASMPKCWRTHSLWMATRLWASRRRSTASSWRGWERTPGWWHHVWWLERGWTKITPRGSSTPSSPLFTATVSCRRTRATCCRFLTFFSCKQIYMLFFCFCWVFCFANLLNCLYKTYSGLS